MVCLEAPVPGFSFADQKQCPSIQQARHPLLLSALQTSRLSPSRVTRNLHHTMAVSVFPMRHCLTLPRSSNSNLSPRNLRLLLFLRQPPAKPTHPQAITLPQRPRPARTLLAWLRHNRTTSVVLLKTLRRGLRARGRTLRSRTLLAQS